MAAADDTVAAFVAPSLAAAATPLDGHAASAHAALHIRSGCVTYLARCPLQTVYVYRRTCVKCPLETL